MWHLIDGMKSGTERAVRRARERAVINIAQGCISFYTYTHARRIRVSRIRVSRFKHAQLLNYFGIFNRAQARRRANIFP